MRYSDITIHLRQKLHGLYPEREIESISFLLAGHVTGLNRTQLIISRERELTTPQIREIGEITRRLQQQEPIQYVLGETEFCGLKLKVRSGVLIPRGETEELVGWVLKSLDEPKNTMAPAAEPGNIAGKSRLKVLDIGCGSGAIAIALAKAHPEAEVVAADISPDALQLTRENAYLNNVTIQTLRLDILSWPRMIPSGDDKAPNPNSHFPDDFTPFDIIVSNPPYIPLKEKIGMDVHVVDYEPELALFVPDSDPMMFYRAIAEFSLAYLAPHGQVLVEIHDRLANETAAVFRKWFSIVEIARDIHGKDRMLRAHHG